MAKSANDPVPLSGSLMLVFCSGSSERGGVGDHYEAAAADPARSRLGDPRGRGPKHGQVSPCLLVDLPEDNQMPEISGAPKQHILVLIMIWIYFTMIGFEFTLFWIWIYFILIRICIYFILVRIKKIFTGTLFWLAFEFTLTMCIQILNSKKQIKNIF